MARVAVVTGAASGIGRAIAERLAREGDQVVVADVQVEQGHAVAQAIGGTFLYADLRRREDCHRLIAETSKRFGTVHILINNAGFQHIDPIEQFPEDIWEAMLAVMLTAPFLLTKYAWPAMKAQRWGRIVNIASIHGLVASPFKGAYVAAKHGLIGLTRVAALEGGPYGITVNAICPAYVRTPLVENQIQDQARTRGIPPEEVVEKVMLEPAAIRRLIEPEEVAALVAYLCSDEASAVTGAAWTIDLGWTAR
ncbi:3-hydroxybutyrate dehydrogenase [Thermoflexus sp.]|uniref:3-hydroxybutyrate dehydrogenase n=1 Tax=Thermoflexus sp. TaxID=1969742 RepID=UPI0035E4390F